MTPPTPATPAVTPPTQTGIVGVLTDGTGASPIGVQKLVKDFVADFLLGAAAAVAAVGITGVGDAVQAPQVAEFAIIGALVRALYRTALSWATSS